MASCMRSEGGNSSRFDEVTDEEAILNKGILCNS
jgi:hypothetical protein